jgi:electron transfer flavoprotein beta subunit
MVSELLDLPFVSYGSELTMNGNVATIARDIEGGKETVELSTPFVISAAKGMAEQRIPNMKGIMMSKTKPIKVVPAQSVVAATTVVKYEYPAEKKGCKMISADNVEELVNLLHNEAKVI